MKYTNLSDAFYILPHRTTLGISVRAEARVRVQCKVEYRVGDQVIVDAGLFLFVVFLDL